MTTEKSLGQIAIEAADDFEDKNDGMDLLELTEGAWEAAAQAVRNATLEEAAKIADNPNWVLPMYEDKELNSISDEAAESVSDQIADRIRALKSKEAGE